MARCTHRLLILMPLACMLLTLLFDGMRVLLLCLLCLRPSPDSPQRLS
jgi:hypothetical protein